MKYIIPFFLIFNVYSLFGQNKDCSNFKIGKFKMEDSLIGTTLITRTDSVQIEYIPQLKIKVALNLKWINDCTYKLTLKETLENPNNYPIGNYILIGKIIETKKNSYTVKATTSESDVAMDFEIFKIE